MSMYLSPEVVRAISSDRLREAQDYRRGFCPCYEETASKPQSRLSRLFGRRSEPAGCSGSC